MAGFKRFSPKELFNSTIMNLEKDANNEAVILREKLNRFVDAELKANLEGCGMEALECMMDSYIKLLEYKDAVIDMMDLGAYFIGAVNDKNYFFHSRGIYIKTGESPYGPIVEKTKEISPEEIQRIIDILEEKFLQAKSKT